MNECEGGREGGKEGGKEGGGVGGMEGEGEGGREGVTHCQGDFEDGIFVQCFS